MLRSGSRIRGYAPTTLPLLLTRCRQRPEQNARPKHARRSFFGPPPVPRFLCTIGGQQVRLDDPRAAQKADALAARSAPARRRPEDDLTSARPSRTRRPQARVLDPGAHRTSDVAPTGRDDGHGSRSPEAQVPRARLPAVLRLRGRERRPVDPRPDLFAEVGGTLVVHFRNTPIARPGADRAPARGQVRAGLRRDRLGDHTTSAASSRPARSSRTRRSDARHRRRMAVPRPRPDHTLNTSAHVRHDHHPRARRKAPDVEQVLFLRSLLPRVTGLRARTRPSTAATPPATRRRSRPESARTSPST